MAISRRPVIWPATVLMSQFVSPLSLPNVSCTVILLISAFFSSSSSLVSSVCDNFFLTSINLFSQRLVAGWKSLTFLFGPKHKTERRRQGCTLSWGCQDVEIRPCQSNSRERDFFPLFTLAYWVPHYHHHCHSLGTCGMELKSLFIVPNDELLQLFQNGTSSKTARSPCAHSVAIVSAQWIPSVPLASVTPETAKPKKRIVLFFGKGRQKFTGPFRGSLLVKWLLIDIFSVKDTSGPGSKNPWILGFVWRNS